MRQICVVVGLALLVVSMATAQTQMSGTALCAPANPSYRVDVGDRPGHAFGLAQGTCTWTTPWEIGGVKNTEGVGTQYQDIMGDSAKIHGTFVDTMANGDKGFYSFSLTLVTKKDAPPQVMNHKWQLMGGTGKLKGVKAQGTCTGSPGGSDGSINYECKGEYTAPKS